VAESSESTPARLEARRLGLIARIRAAAMRHEPIRGYALLSPTMVWMLLVLATPLIILVTLSFWTQQYLDFDRSFSINNYIDFYEKPIILKLLIKSVKISGIVTFVTVLLAYPAAYFIAFKVEKNKLMWLILITVPFWISYLLRIFAWKVVLGYKGVINSGLMSLGIIDAPLEFILYNPTAVVITLAHAWAAFAILPIYVSLEKIDRSLLEAAADLGEGPVMSFVRVTLPLSMPGIIAASLLIFIPTTGDYVTPNLVGGPTGIMIGNIIGSLFGKSNNWPLGAATAVMSMMFITILVCAFLWFTKRVRNPVTMIASETRKSDQFGWLGIYTVIYLVFIYMPVLVLPVFSFNDSIYVAFPLKGFTFKWYEDMANNTGMIVALMNSIKVGAVVAVLSTIFGTLAAKAVTRYRMPGREPVVGFIMLPLVIPGVILGIALLVMINTVGIPLSLFTIGVGHMLVCIPFSMLVMISCLEGFDKHLEEAALDLGENPWWTFWRVTFPLAIQGLIASLLLTFTISFDEFILAFFLSGTDVTLPVFIWSQLRFPNMLPGVLALGTAVLTVSFVMITFAEWLRKQGNRMRQTNYGKL
jgi:spermidine/putrescine transport system permease protein